MQPFILEYMEEILDEWDRFAETLTPAADTMTAVELRDHARQMLEAIAADIETKQTKAEQAEKSKGLADNGGAVETAASTHGALRHTLGFDLKQLVAEFRALRASVLALWVAKKRYDDPNNVYWITRFNESIDQALAESVDSYSEELATSRDTFLAILGHDLRSPLSALAGSLNILKRPVNDDQRSRACEIGNRSVAAMNSLIRDLLEYTRSRLGKGIPVTCGDADLDAVCRQAVSEIALAYPQSEFTLESPGRLDGFFDDERMAQVISNLLNNAVQHGGRTAAVRLAASGNADKLCFEVHNQGRAIPANSLQTIFEPLVQLALEAAGQERATNLGLGLHIAREIVLAHGGTIEVTSSTEQGTTFRVEFPRAGT